MSIWGRICSKNKFLTVSALSLIADRCCVRVGDGEGDMEAASGSPGSCLPGKRPGNGEPVLSARLRLENGGSRPTRGERVGQGSPTARARPNVGVEGRACLLVLPNAVQDILERADVEVEGQEAMLPVPAQRVLHMLRH